ncbi:hypothetical protein [Xenorhabdus eapokensis]|uniref:DUF3168 domain-containing protein n=1 Tax=Xenorhabdus eapokensis TaxID=1873482 RepID=A0A1Q5TFL4_9GAMM|nr:hypothetical protein [Xenorhabdus eapokensis]OKO99029.1 hypothetical protein Xedl_03771 [Xenorhabdus eapokensis]
MIELDIHADLERITQLPVYPLILPSSVLEGVTYQRISDPKFNAGLAPARLIEGRFQIGIITLNYTKALQLEARLRSAWEVIQHGAIGRTPVQTISRGALMQDMIEETSNRKRYRVTRDFIITFAEVPDD